jgi:hypothetical protein
MTLDLSQLTTVDEVGLCWLHRAWLQVDGASGYLWTVRVAERYRALVPTSAPQLVVVDKNRQSPAAATLSGNRFGHRT